MHPKYSYPATNRSRRVQKGALGQQAPFPPTSSSRRYGVKIQHRIDDDGSSHRRIAHQISDRECAFVKERLNFRFHGHASNNG